MKQLLFLVLLVFMVAAQVSWSAVPETMSYQGRLTDGSGNAVADDTYSLTFSIYDVSAGGSALWTETYGNVATVNGIFNVILGSDTPLDIAFDKQYWLGIKVGGGAEHAPRIKLTSSPYSLNARSVADGAVDEDAIADDAVTSGKIADGQVVRSVNGKTDDVTLAAGTNVTITPSGNTLTISATGGGGSGWSLTGNAGTTPPTNFLGTTDNAPLEFWVNSLRALRLEPHTNIIGGFNGNWITSGVYGATIAGGGSLFNLNRVTDGYGVVGGGSNNQAGNGDLNAINALFATVSGGVNNDATAGYATVGGGVGNEATDVYATVGGGLTNKATVDYATVGGGRFNEATGDHATVGGGRVNTATDNYCTVSGGRNNQAGNRDTNTTNARYATVGGGWNNEATGDHATVGGGYTNEATSDYATVSGGVGNTASGNRATVGGGGGNTATGECAVVPGGCGVSASADYSFAAGSHAKANHVGAFVWGDASTEAEVTSTHDHQFLVRASGGTWLYSNPELTSGVRLSGGSSAIATVSDRNMKTNIRQVNAMGILDRLSEIPISRWNYKTQSPSIEHIGPMAQDFYAAFGLDEDDKHISTVDADGVALAAIQGLYEMVKEKDAENAALRQCVDDLESRLAALEALVSSQ